MVSDVTYERGKIMKVKVTCCGVAALVSVTLLLSGTVGYAKEARGVTNDTIKYGIVCDMTGPVARQSQEHMRGFKNCLLNANDQGGIHGRNFKITIEDDHYSIPASVAAFKKLVYKDKVMAVWGSIGTQAANALFPRIAKEKIPYSIASVSDIVTKPYKRYVFGSASSYEDNIKVIYDYIMKDLNAKDPKISLVCSDNEHGKVGQRAAEKSAQHYNIKPPGIEILAPMVLDATSQVLSLKRTRPDYIIIHGIVPNTAALLRDARKFGLRSNFFGTYFSCSEEMVRMAKKAAENFTGAHCLSSWDDKGPGIAGMREIALKYQPKKTWRSRDYIQGWVTGLTHVEAIKRAGKNLDAESFVDALETIKDFSTKGLSGPITYDSKSHKPLDSCKLFKADVENGSLIPVTDWRKPSF